MPRPRYKLYYWPGIQGRGELIRLAFEEAGVAYLDMARQPESKGGGVAGMMQVLRGDGRRRMAHFAPPILEVGAVRVSQTTNILDFIAPSLRLVPRDPKLRLAARQLQLTIADLIAEIHDVHHPIASSLYYEDQKPEARRRAGHLVGERLPKYLGYFEGLLGRARRGHLVGDTLTYVDLSMFQVMAGLGHAFPRAMRTLEAKHPRLVAQRDRVAARPRIAAYLASDRRIAWNEHDLFRAYAELDAGGRRA